jgi:hypothetical protein
MSGDFTQVAAGTFRRKQDLAENWGKSHLARLLL